LGTLWLKIKVWTKVFIAFALLVYAVVFVYQNSSRSVTPWFWFGHEPPTSVLVLVLCSFLVGVIGTILFRTTIKTLRQFRNLRERTRAERLEREMAEMRTKAAMLRSKGAPEAGEDAAVGEAELP
jgi:uncharacterized integral membrane protein